jgi:tetratricopeptide (TPR) repeat protein
MLNLSRIQVACFLSAVLCLAPAQTGCFAVESDWEKNFNAGMKALQEGRLSEGEKLLRDTLKMEEKQGASDLKRAQSSMALADFYRSRQRYAEAEALYKQLLSKFENSSTEDQLPSVMSRLAGLYKEQGKYEEARSLYKKALAIVEARDGSDSGSAGMLHANLGLLYQRMDKLKDAELEELTAIKLLQSKLGQDSLEAAQCMCDLALQYMLEHKTKQAIQLLEQALAIYEKKAASGLLYAGCAEQLGNAYFVEERYADAEALSRKALEIFQKRLGQASKDVAIALTNLAGRLARQDKMQEALDCYNKSMAIQEKQGQFAPGLLTNLHGIAEVYVAQTEYKKAEAVLRKDLALREKKWGPKHASLIPALRNLSSCLSIEGAPVEESDLLLNRAEEILDQVPVTRRRMVAEMTAQEMIKGLDLNLKKNKKKDRIW